jgi:transcription elongation factor GreA|tara:strand:+ start:3176 stop:3661 length:486 start_codon:yes stop_codon:yes gene_type:complete
MAITKVPMTVRGEQLLRTELKELKSVTRPRIIKDIATAREHGDLKENAEYHAARDQQSFCEGRIQEVEAKLSLVQVIDISQIAHTGTVIFGTTVTIINLDTDEEKVYCIVGEDEADIKVGKISLKSPIARALIGKNEGDEVRVTTPGGMIDYEIAVVQHIA